MKIKLKKEILSPEGKNIQLLKAGETSDGQTVLLIGVFHGDEQDGEFLINKLMEDIKEDSELTGNNELLLIPCLNPDGKSKNIRGNSNGVDLNRNFPTKNWVESEEKDEYYSGESPASEIETQFIVDILEEYKPDRILTIHSPYKVVNYDGPADKLSSEMSRLNGYPVQVDIGYPTPGSFGTYAGKERKIPTITLELPVGSSQETLWLENKKALYHFISA